MRRFDAVVARHDLNEHPFYRAWREGTLPRAALAAYAADYAAFVETIEMGWRTLGDEDHATLERHHAGLWAQFRDAVGSSSAPACHEARTLAEEARHAFSDPVTAVGALYAFEAQQPRTARSKLEGLVRHYALAPEATAYFRAHADDYGEREGLSARAASLTPAEVARAEEACEATCRAMWVALDGVMASSGVACA
jgi:pyrroloquinoline-quinone synthase